MTTTDRPVSPGGNYWWNGETWLATTPPPAPRRKRTVWILLALIAVIVAYVLIMTARGEAEQEKRDTPRSYCETLGLNDPSCAYMYR